MTARPVPVRPGPDLDRHADARAHVVAGTTDPRQIPARAEIARPHFRIALEPAAGEHHRVGGDLGVSVRAAHLHPGDPALLVLDQPGRRGLISDFAADLEGARHLCLDQPGAATDGFYVHTAVEMVLAFDLEGLPTEHRDEPDAVLAQPNHRGARAVDQPPCHGLVGLMMGDFHEGLVEHVPIMHGQNNPLPLRFGQIDQHIGRRILDSAVAETESSGGEGRVAAALMLRCGFQDQHPRAILACRQGRAQGRIPGTDHHHVIVCHHPSPPVPSAVPSSAADLISRR